MTERLNEYKQKRNFDRTPEPAGFPETPAEGLRFVVQHHLARRDHYDLRLEWDGVFLSWAVPKGPSYNPGDKRLAVQVEDHPLEYRNFEGTIPQGEYGGGVVMIWDEGFWEPHGDVDEGLRQGMLKFVLRGKRLKGKWALVKLKGKTEKENNWLLLKERDEYVQATDGIALYSTSIRTGRTMEEIEKGIEIKFPQNPFKKTGIQLAKAIQRVPEGEDWLFELKYDGYRVLAYIENNNVRLMSRNGRDFTGRFPQVAHSLARWAEGRAMVLDGEMVVTDAEGKTDFQALQNYLKHPQNLNLTYIVFDLLAIDGADLRGQPLLARKELLAQLMKDAPANLHYSRHIRGRGAESLAAACEAGMEGIIAKKINSLYRGTRNDDWVKLKCDNRQEFVIGGFVTSIKRTEGIRSLLLGLYEGKELIYVGRAGTGLADQDRKELTGRFKDLVTDEPPFAHPPKPKLGEQIIWLKPHLVAEIKFAGWTADRLLRQASFKGLRLDKDPREVQWATAETVDAPAPLKPSTEKLSETAASPDALPRTSPRTLFKAPPDLAQKTPPKPLFKTTEREEHPMKVAPHTLIIGGIPISNPDKVIYADLGITKADVVRYYAQVAERMLPYVSHRILSIVRCPKGIGESCFYKKHPGPGNQGIVTVSVPTGEGKTEEYFYIEDAAGLVGEAQMGTLEFHIWGSRVENLEKPDLMVFDLDPDEGMELEKVRQGVRDLRAILAELSLKCYLKTSGGKGYHVVVPFKPAASWDVFYDFARRVALVMEQKWPERYTSNVRKDKRAGKIFIDWMRNGRGATSIAPYSLRARAGAKVSMPIAWEELDAVPPDGIDLAEALRRMNGEDPWQDVFATDQRLKS